MRENILELSACAATAGAHALCFEMRPQSCNWNAPSSVKKSYWAFNSQRSAPICAIRVPGRIYPAWFENVIFFFWSEFAGAGGESRQNEGSLTAWTVPLDLHTSISSLKQKPKLQITATESVEEKYKWNETQSVILWISVRSFHESLNA